MKTVKKRIHNAGVGGSSPPVATNSFLAQSAENVSLQAPQSDSEVAKQNRNSVPLECRAKTTGQPHGDAQSRFHGVFSPNSKLRKYVVPWKPVEEQENPKPKAYSMTHCSFGGAAAQACVLHRY